MGKIWLNQKEKTGNVAHTSEKIAENLDDQGLERSCESTMEERSSEG